MDDGEQVRYDECLLATGNVDVSGGLRAHVADERAQPFVGGVRSARDRLALRNLLSSGDAHITVVGGSWEAVALASAAVAPRYSARYLRQRRDTSVLDTTSASASKDSLLSGDASTAGARVSLVFPESSPLRKSLPRYLSS